MIEKERIKLAIFDAIDDFNALSPKEVSLTKSADTVLYGDSGKLNSLDLVNLIVIVEEKIAEEFDRPITIADERAMSQASSPFLSVQSLASYVSMLMTANAGD